MADILIHGEGMRKPVYLGVLGISIVVAAVSIGVTLTRYHGLRAYSPKGTVQAAAAPAVSNVPATPVEEWNNLFAPGDGMKMASRLAAVNANSGSQTPRSAFTLLGTIVSSTPSARRAILWASGMKEPKAFREKDEVEPGAFLASVERDKVWIMRGKAREKLEILPVGSRARPMAAESTTDAPVVASPGPNPAPLPGMTSRPGAVVPSGLSSDRTQTVAPQSRSPGDDDEELSPRERRKRRIGRPR